MSADELGVVIGEIVSPFGRKGEVKVLSLTDFPERFEELKQAFVSKGPIGGRVLKVEKVWFHKGAVIIKFAGIDDISAAEALRGFDIRIRESELAPLGENQYYIHDVIGLDVVTTEGQDLGKIREVLRSPANDVYVTDRAMIPAVKEFVVSIDLGERKMIVKPIQGLLQEEQDED